MAGIVQIGRPKIEDMGSFVRSNASAPRGDGTATGAMTTEPWPGRIRSQIRQLASKQSKAFHATLTNNTAHERPKRPKRLPFVDALCTESSLGVFGPYSFSGGGPDSHSGTSIVPLDTKDITSPYNHTKVPFSLSLLSFGSDEETTQGGAMSSQGSRTGRVAGFWGVHARKEEEQRQSDDDEAETEADDRESKKSSLTKS
mmetsp:Transcript_12269/g.35995  ORF Transcript_12269/g.35995 Transcript_12269/m.35995 type:complete len:200 (+) Transcript_12269:148-747(+)